MKATQKRRLISLMVVLTFILTMVKIPFTGEVTASAAEMKLNNYATLVGDFQGWNPKELSTIMTQITPDIYVKNLDLTAGNHAYKATMNGAWDKSYGNGGENKSLILAAQTMVQFVLDTKQGAIYDSINDAGYFKNTATVVGSLDANGNGGPSWNPGDSRYDLVKLDNGYFKGTFPMKKGVYDYKVAYDHKWSNGEVGENSKTTLDADSNVTFFSNVYASLCTDSIKDSSILVIPSLVGTARQAGADDWSPEKKGFEFNYFGDGKYIFGKYMAQGSFAYKVLMNYGWGNGEIPGDNKPIAITDANGEYVVYVYDAKNHMVYDSVNNKTELAKLLGLIKDTSSPTINPNGTVTFTYKAPDATSVVLKGTMNGWTGTAMTKEADGNWTVTQRVGDAAANLEYKFVVNGTEWVTDPLNSNTANGNSLLVFPQYAGRKVVVAGTIQSAAGESNWTPSSDKTAMSYVRNGLYKLVVENVAAGSYEYKVAMGAWEPENYGAGGAPHGANIALTVPVKQSVTFLYNDDSHRIVDSTSYKVLDTWLSGGTLGTQTQMTDSGLTGVYSTSIKLEAGTYNTFVVTIKGEGGKTISVPEFVVDAAKLVTISYDPVTGFVFQDASSKKIETAGIQYNSRELKYKTPYGAVKQNQTTTFTIETGLDVAAARLVLLTPSGTRILDMTQTKGVTGSSFRADAVFDAIGTSSYYFVLSNGSDIVAYGDDAKQDLGLGTTGAIGSVKSYTVNVYHSDFKTPDWMKNAVVYQIFPDRFFNGDTKNDKAQMTARGDDNYELYSNWYAIPENPREEQKDLNAYINNGGTVGDMKWSNEMYGGDIAGIKAKLNYLQALGVNVLYLNPISASISNHRYDTSDYKALDPLLGYMDEYKQLAAEVNKRGMHLIIDGVYNHVSDDSVYFDRYAKFMKPGKPLGAYQYWQHVYSLVNQNGVSLSEAELQTASYYAGKGITDLHYKDWFKIDNVWLDKDSSGNAIEAKLQHYQYEGWWGYDSMPIIQAPNGSELNVASWKDEIVKGNTELWLGMGTGGYRLDVANEVSDETWKYFRDVVKGAGDNVIIGEIWTDASKYILGDMYDSVMNYRYRDAVLSYLRDGVSGNDVNNTLEVMREQYPREAFETMMNLVDSHDTERILSDMDGMVKDKTDEMLAPVASDKAKKLQRLVPILQMTYPGAPTIYYGDELGMVGAKDPDNRRPMAWGKGDKDTLTAYAASANIRNNYAVLRTGDVAPVVSSNGDLIIYERYNGADSALVVVNKGDGVQSLQASVNHVADGTVLTDAMTGKTYTVAGGKVQVSVQGISGVILVTGYKPLTLNHASLTDGWSSDAIVGVKTHTVTFLDAQGKTIRSESVLVGQTVAYPAAPYLFGHSFVKWSMTEEEIASSEGNVTVSPEFTINATKITIKVTGGSGSGDYNVKEYVTITAETPKSGEKFSHWTDSKGSIVSYAPTYKYYVSHSEALTAHYVKKTETVVQKANVVLTGVNEKQGIVSFVADRVIPQGATEISHGILATKDQTLGTSVNFKVEAIPVNTSISVKGTAKTKGLYGTYVLNKKVSQGETWYAVGYVTYTLNGTKTTVYSNIVHESVQ